ncbi:MAG: hypothetical protein U0931_38725 [Vulcanimicrobiota bacterium]
MNARPPWSFRLRCWVRLQILGSSRWQPLWRLVYRLAEWLVVLRLSRFSEVRALYLRRGASKGELLPGVSDLDWTVILGPISAPRRKLLESAYASLSRLFPFLETELMALEESELPAIWARPENWYRWREARQTWKLKHGRDALSEMPELPQQVWAGWHREVKTWINVWVKNLLNHPWRFSDRVYRNATSFKLLCEFLKLELASVQGRETFQRRQALAWCPEQHPWLQPLLTMQNSRFLESGTEFSQWTFGQMLVWLEQFRAHMAQSGYAGCRQSFNLRRVGQPDFPDWQRQQAARLADRARELWGERLLDWTMSSCLCFPPQDLIVLLRVDPKNPPRLEDIRTLLAPMQSLAVKPYLWFGSSALALRPDWNVSDNSLLSVQENPDLLLALNPAEQVGYSPVMLQYFFTRWGRQPVEDRFESEFWWSAQMAVYFAHACENALVVPRSCPEIGAELELLGYPITFDLRNRPAAATYLSDLWAKVKERPRQNFA